MSKILGTEKRTCPFCKHKYIRTLYADNVGRGSICPKCRKRSDRSRGRFYRWKAPKLKHCDNSECNNVFYANGRQKYCGDCMEPMRLKHSREYVRDWRRRNKLKNKV